METGTGFGLPASQVSRVVRPVGGQSVAGEGPQLISLLQAQVKSLYELRQRLADCNERLRGVTPQLANDARVPVEKEPDMSLTNLIRAIAVISERCHAEMNEISGLLT
jgi:hypothetical protein